MKLLCAAIFVAILVGCSTTAVDQNLVEARKGSSALLALMRSRSSPFHWARSKDFKLLEVEFRSNDQYTWGPFVISPSKKYYTAHVGGPGCNWFYNGRFTVDASSKWTAEQPNVVHANNPVANDGGNK